MKWRDGAISTAVGCKKAFECLSTCAEQHTALPNSYMFLDRE